MFESWVIELRINADTVYRVLIQYTFPNFFRSSGSFYILPYSQSDIA